MLKTNNPNIIFIHANGFPPSSYKPLFKNIQTREWGNGFETKVNYVEDVREFDMPLYGKEYKGAFQIEIAM